MIYIICHDWKSTSGNHAGMLHLYKEIIKRKPEETKLYVINKGGRNQYVNMLHILWICLLLSYKLKKGDKVLLTECVAKTAKQEWIARWIKVIYPKISVYGMIHLIPSIIEKVFTHEDIKRSASYLDCVITLGSSLTKYLNDIGINNVHTSFHYLDENYYVPTRVCEVSEKPNVIAMGGLGRDFKLLANIVRKTPSAHFTICKGQQQIDELFEGCENVTLLGFIREDELRHQMDFADISMNVMKDTIGSNVICTSLGMGLAMICSNVGSIHDYCNESNTIFCNEVDDFSNAIKLLSSDRNKLLSMKKSSFEASKRLHIDRYVEDIWNLMYN